ncbi:MAG: ASKHA domain-containing protein [Oscillospiraceae bacterium]|nr:ASKHA domain-containing protein [Oscillospiraceae bacterium]
MPQIVVMRGGKEVRRAVAPEGACLCDALAQDIALTCGGKGLCGKCRVRVFPAPPPGARDEQILPRDDLAAGWRLACLTAVQGDATVTLPESVAQATVPVVTLPWMDAPADAPVCLALDVGTTTLGGMLHAGGLVYAAARPNPQRRCAADVMGRIALTMERDDGLALLRETLRPALAELCGALLAASGVAAQDVTQAALAGNPAMTQIALGMPVAALGSAPYTPGYTGALCLRAADVGLALPGATLYVPPCASGFVGADALAAALACALDMPGPWRLMVDIGTNTEMVLSDGRQAFCCAAASGPALEGACIAQGMPALPGAIASVRIEEGEVRCQVIGGVEAVGLCGSGLVDAVARLAALGTIDSDGAFCDAQNAGGLAGRFGRRGEARAFALTQRIWLTQTDVRQLQLAKGAIAAGIALLLDAAGIDAADVTRLCLCGAFGAGLDVASAQAVGLLPALSVVDKREGAAAWGALAMAAGEEARRRAQGFAARLQALDLAAHPQFTDTFMAHMALRPWAANQSMKEGWLCR